MEWSTLSTTYLSLQKKSKYHVNKLFILIFYLIILFYMSFYLLQWQIVIY